MPSISLVIAAYNESATLEGVFARCLLVLEELSDDFEVVILDDASTDETAEIAAAIDAGHCELVRGALRLLPAGLPFADGIAADFL